jgi:hypothetical protein
VRSCVVAATVALLLAVSVPAAHASVGPKRLQVLAAGQTELLFAGLTQPAQIASPATCVNVLGVTFLPALSYNAGDMTFDCRASRDVVLDLGGALASEDARGDTWTLADGVQLPFTRPNLERICDDVLRVFPPGAPATLDGRPIGGTQVSIPPIPVLVHKNAPAPLYQDSVDVRHPGLLNASYCGWKTELRLTPGRHAITADLTEAAGAPTRFTYDLTVR